MLTWAAWSPVLQATFLWDDEFLVTRNPFSKSPVLILEAFRHFLFTDARGEFYRPVQNLSYMIDYGRAGLSATVFHQTNLILHGMNGLLIFLLSSRLIRDLGNVTRQLSWYLAFALAAVWVVHPVHSAIAAYVSGRADSLALAGMLGAWLCWESSILRLNEGQKWRHRATCAMGFILALAGCCAKEIAAAGLGLFLLYLWLLRIDLANSRRVATTVGVMVVFGSYLLLRQLPEANIAPPGNVAVPWGERPALAVRAMGDYARLLVFPEKLFMERQVGIPTGLFTDPVKNDPLFPWLQWVGSAALLLLAGSAFWQGRGHRLRMLGVLWFGAMILPVSNLFSLNATVAEHWLYIPSVGILLWLTGCWLDLAPRWQRFLLILLPVALLALGMRTYQRAEDWKDPLIFYRATIRDGGDSVRVRINLAAEYQNRGQLAEAERIYRSLLRVMPGFTLGRLMLAHNLTLQKRTVEAGELVASGNAETSVTEKAALFDAMRQNRQTNQVAKLAREAYEKNPNSWVLARALSRVYEEQGRTKAAMEVVKGFVARNWWHADGQVELGRLCAAEKLTAPALDAWREAARLDIRNAEPLNQAALLLAGAGQYDEALGLSRRALARDSRARQKEILLLIQETAAENRGK